MQIVVQILEDNPDEFNAGLVVTVTVIVLAQGMEGKAYLLSSLLQYEQVLGFRRCLWVHMTIA